MVQNVKKNIKFINDEPFKIRGGLNIFTTNCI